MDVYLSEEDEYSKHIIFYFDESELDNIRQLKDLLEDLHRQHQKEIFDAM